MDAKRVGDRAVAALRELVGGGPAQGARFEEAVRREAARRRVLDGRYTEDELEEAIGEELVFWMAPDADTRTAFHQALLDIRDLPQCREVVA